MNEQKKSWQQSRWSLADLFTYGDTKAIDTAVSELDKMVAAFEKHRDSLNDAITSTAFLSVVKDFEEITKRIQCLGGFAELWFTEDTQNQAAQSLTARMDQMSADYSNRVLFFTLWWKDLDDAAAARLMQDAGDIHYWLEEMRHLKPYTLSEAEEKVINIKDVTGSRALVLLYDAFTNRYTFKLNVDGREKEMTRGELMTYVRMPNADLRAQAYQELNRVYGKDGSILGQMYQTLARDWRNELIGMRGYKTPISARNLNNDIPDEVIDTLLDVSRKNSGVFQRFFKLKARLLKVEKLRRYDIYAPLTASTKEYSFNVASEMILDSFDQFDPRFAQLALKVISENHVDSEVRKGKRTGAFCATITPELTPWVLLNYQGHSDDVATMAHELGHAIHALLASGHSIFTQNACLPLAETASTFGEMMLVDRLLQEERDESVRRDLLFRQVDDSYATIMRQVFFALFEKQAHEMTQQGASVDELSDAYFKNLQTQFGDSLDISDEFKWEWVSIPHIYHTPFYVYAYAFGQLLVLSLYKQFKEEGDAFKPRYIRLLSAGGSDAPARVLADAGVDIHQAAFWQGGFDVVDGLVSQLEKMG